jgi:hypothetical protein
MEGHVENAKTIIRVVAQEKEEEEEKNKKKLKLFISTLSLPN